MPSYVIVGASQGLGYEWLRQLSRDPANTVVGLARTPKKVEPRLASDSITNVHLLQADMSDYKSLNAAAAETAKITGGSLDYLIVNGVYQNQEENFLSGTEFIGKEDLLLEALTESTKVNVAGTIFSVNAFLPLIRKGTTKKITVISTGLADLDAAQRSNLPCSIAYSSSKAAVNIVVARYAAELKSEGVIFLALSPGFVNTRDDKPAVELPEFIQKKIAVMMADFKKSKPDFSGPISPEESVQAQKKVIEGLTLEQSGSFLSHHGDKNWL